MNKTTFDEALRRFQQAERPEAVLLVASDKDYLRIVAAWVHSEVDVNRRLCTRTATSDEATWDWLWRNCHFSRDLLREMSGVPAARFDQKLNALLANRILYPDGSVNSFVRHYVHGRVLRLLGLNATVSPRE